MEKIIYVKEGDLYDINSVLKRGDWTVKTIVPVAPYQNPTTCSGHFGAYVIIESKED